MSRRKNRSRRKVETSESIKKTTTQENDQSVPEEEIPSEQTDYNDDIPGVPVENLDTFLGGAFKKMLQSIGVIGGDPMVQNQQIQTQLTPQQQYALALQLAQNQQMQNQQPVPQVQVQQPQPVVNQQVQNPQPVQQQVVQPQQVIATMPNQSNQSAEQASLDASALATVNNPNEEETKMDTQTQMQNAQNMANTLNNLSPEEQAVFLALQAKANGNIQDSQKIMNQASINEGEISMNNQNNNGQNNNDSSIFDALPDFTAKNVAIGTLAAVGAVTVGKKAYDMYKGTDADRDVSELASSFADSDVSKAAGDIFKELF